MGERMVVVVGAGASREFGLPMGNELKDRIAESCTVNWSGGAFFPNDSKISEAVQMCAQLARVAPKEYLKGLQEISEALPLAISIDNYLDIRKEDPIILQCGKIAIIRLILEAERSSNLFVREGKSLNFDPIKNTWIAEFFRVVTENCMLEHIAARLAGITFVIFNYDRCIEHFFFHALQTYYRITPEKSAEILSCVNFLHPYGTLGSLPWESEKPGLEYGADIPTGELVELAKGILTFTESTLVPQSDLKQIQDAIASTPMLIFLGFAFHRINMRLLFSELHVSGRYIQIFGTAYKVSEYDTKFIVHELRNKFKSEAELRNDLVCDKLFGEYSRAISLGV